jgi:hypothetical protein
MISSTRLPDRASGGPAALFILHGQANTRFATAAIAIVARMHHMAERLQVIDFVQKKAVCRPADLDLDQAGNRADGQTVTIAKVITRQARYPFPVTCEPPLQPARLKIRNGGNRMKKLVVSAIAALSFAATAASTQAADIPARVEAQPPAPIEVFNP